MSGGAIVWFTGLPASGKTTLARRLQQRLHHRAVVLDSDELRAVLHAQSYGEDDRDEQYRILAELAALIAHQGFIALVAATAPKLAHRAHHPSELPFLEVYLKTPLPQCVARDLKGLYARAAADKANTLPGLGAAYEPPAHPDVVADGAHDEAALETLERLLAPQALRDRAS